MDGNALGPTTDKAKVELEARQDTGVGSGRCASAAGQHQCVDADRSAGSGRGPLRRGLHRPALRSYRTQAHNSNRQHDRAGATMNLSGAARRPPFRAIFLRSSRVKWFTTKSLPYWVSSFFLELARLDPPLNENLVGDSNMGSCPRPLSFVDE